MVNAFQATIATVGATAVFASSVKAENPEITSTREKTGDNLHGLFASISQPNPEGHLVRGDIPYIEPNFEEGESDQTEPTKDGDGTLPELTGESTIPGDTLTRGTSQDIAKNLAMVTGTEMGKSGTEATEKGKTPIPTLDEIEEERVEIAKEWVTKWEQEKIETVVRELITSIFKGAKIETAVSDVIVKYDCKKWEEELIFIGEEVYKEGLNILAEWRRINTQLDQEITQLKQANAQWREANAQWREANAQWREANAQLKQANAQWREANAQWREANAQLKQANAQLKQANAQLKQANAQWREANATEIEQIKKNLLVAEQKLNLLSTTYKDKSPDRIRSDSWEEIQKSVDLFIKYGHTCSQETVDRLNRLGISTDWLKIKVNTTAQASIK